MTRRIVRACLPWMLLVPLAAACRGGDGPPAPPDGAPAPANTTDPHWVERHTPPAKIAVVFVHGIFGDTVGTWTHAGGTSMFDLVRQNPAIGPKVDLLAFGYTSNMLTAGSLDVQEAANLLHARLQFHGVFDYPAIVFVTHSMGGLVALRELLTQRAILPKVKGLVFYGTPQEGAQIT